VAAGRTTSSNEVNDGVCFEIRVDDVLANVQVAKARRDAGAEQQASRLERELPDVRANASELGKQVAELRQALTDEHEEHHKSAIQTNNYESAMKHAAEAAARVRDEAKRALAEQRSEFERERQRLAEQQSEADKRARHKVQTLLQLHEQHKHEAEDLRQQLCAAKASSSKEPAANSAAPAEKKLPTKKPARPRKLVALQGELSHQLVLDPGF
jgi:chromosome segregation ATPase